METFDLNCIKIDEKSYKDILIYHIGHVTVKENVKIYSANSLYLIFRYVNGFFEENSGNEYLTLVPTNEGKGKNKKYEELFIKTRDWIRSITKNSDDYDKKYLKIKFNSDDELPLNKTIKVSTIIAVVRAIFLENNKYYPQFLLDKSIHKI